MEASSGTNICSHRSRTEHPIGQRALEIVRPSQQGPPLTAPRITPDAETVAQATAAV
jgi:hypothetical protein